MKSLTSRAAREKSFLLLAVSLLNAAVGSAQTSVDPLSAAQAPLTAAGGTTTAAVVTDASILGGERDVRLRHRSGPGSSVLTVTGGVLSLTSGATTNAELTLTWDGADGDAFNVATAGLAANLSAGGGGALRLALNSTSAGISATVRLWSTTGASSKSLIVPTLAAPQAILLPFASFTPVDGAGADFTQVGAIEILFLGTGATLSLDSIEIASAGAQLKGDLLDNAVTVGPGGTLHYNAPLTNQGPANAAGVRLQVPLPTAATLVPGSLEVSPVAADDSAWVAHDSTLTVPAPGVLSNDQDMETPPDAIAVNPPGPRVTFRGGSATVNPNGSFSYQPPSGFVGVDRFDYLVDDGNGIPGPGTVFVDVQCSPIVVTPSSLSAGGQGLGYTPVTFSATGAPTQISWSALGLPAGLWIGASSGGLSGTPTVAGTFAVQIHATDTASCPGTRNISLLIEPPVADPVLSPSSGRWYTQRSISVTTATPGATIYYTMDGTEPTTSSTPIPANGELLVDRAMVVKVRAFKSGLSDSASARGQYLVTGQIAAGADFTLALKADGTVWAWGLNNEGQLGLGDLTNRVSPTQIPGLTTITAIVAGEAHALALRSDGTVMGWGAGGSGRLGLGDTASRTTPTAIPAVSLSGVVALAAGEDHSLAIIGGGAVRAWGSNIWGQLGDGTSTQRLVPSTTLFPAAQSIAAGRLFSLTLDSGGVVRGAGSNTSGELGDNTTTNRSTPVITVLPPGSIVTAISAGRGRHAVARLGPSREAWAWGANITGQQGTGLISVNTLVPAKVAPHVFDVAIGASHTLFDRLDWGLFAAGSGGSNGPLGLGALTPSTVSRPLPLSSPPRTTVLAAGRTFSAAVSSLGSVWTWGSAIAGIGHGDTLAKAVPAVISSLSLVSNEGLLGDPDGDGLDTDIEFLIGTDPFSADTNQNGVDDGDELRLGNDPNTADADGDGLSDAWEATIGTDPNAVDTDGDTVPDGVDAFPLDSTKSALTSTGGDTTPPLIQLLRPATAVPIPGGDE